MAEGEAKTDLNAHVRSYSGFIRMMKWGTIVSFIAAMLVIFLVA